MPSRVFPKEGVVDYAHLVIEECGVKDCRHDGRRPHHHTINPRSHAVKHVEMTVRRALALIDVFQRWEERFNKSGYQGVQDWRDIDPSEYRKVMGDDHYGIQPQMEIEELWRRYKSGQLHEEVLALADNLVMDDLEDPGRKEIRDGTRRIRKEFDR